MLRHRRLEDGLGVILASKLQTAELPAILLRDLILEAFADEASIRGSIRCGIYWRRGTARPGLARLRAAVPLLQRLSCGACKLYRVAHWLWGHERYMLASHLQNRISEAFGVDVHPAARIGSGVIIDHGTSVVIGETAVVEDNVSLLHEVTLGGTGKQSGDRHPKVRRGVLIGAGAKILGNIEIGIGAKVAAGSVVLRDVPPSTTVAGIPARIVGRCTVAEPALEMDATFPYDVDLRARDFESIARPVTVRFIRGGVRVCRKPKLFFVQSLPRRCRSGDSVARARLLSGGESKVITELVDHLLRARQAFDRGLDALPVCCVWRQHV